MLDFAVLARVNSPSFATLTAGPVVAWLLQKLAVSPGGLVPKGDGGFGEEGGQSGSCDGNRAHRLSLPSPCWGGKRMKLCSSVGNGPHHGVVPS